jgi:hypothetical protein
MSCGSWLARSLVSRGLGCPSVLNRHRSSALDAPFRNGAIATADRIQLGNCLTGKGMHAPVARNSNNISGSLCLTIATIYSLVVTKAR